MRSLIDNSPTRLAIRPEAVALAVVAALTAGAIALSVNANDAECATGDNIVFILTDDQAANELAAMPNMQSLIGGKGTTFRRGYVPYPLCCPSRASLLTANTCTTTASAATSRRSADGRTSGPTRRTRCRSGPRTRLLQPPHRQVLERLRGGPHRRRCRSRPLGRVVREDLRGPPLLQLPADREDRAGRHARARSSTATRRASTRPMSSETRRVSSSDGVNASQSRS